MAYSDKNDDIAKHKKKALQAKTSIFLPPMEKTTCSQIRLMPNVCNILLPYTDDSHMNQRNLAIQCTLESTTT